MILIRASTFAMKKKIKCSQVWIKGSKTSLEVILDVTFFASFVNEIKFPMIFSFFVVHAPVFVNSQISKL